MISPSGREPERDPRIAGALRSVTDSGTAGEELLIRRIASAARPRLSALRTGPGPWWEWTAAWARVAVPAAVAASILGGVLVARAGDSWAADALVTESALVLGAGEPASGSVLAAELLPQPTAEWLITEAFDR